MIKSDYLMMFQDFNTEVISKVEKLNIKQRNSLKKQLQLEIETMKTNNFHDDYCIHFCESVIKLCDDLHKYPTLDELKIKRKTLKFDFN